MTITDSATSIRQMSWLLFIACALVLGICLAAMFSWGVWALLTAWIFAIGVLFAQKRYWSAGITLALLIGLLMFPTLGGAKTAARRAQCLNHLKVVSIAILNYERHHGHLPPPYTTDESGQPLHSWRVLILPFLEEQELYDAIDLSKPWHHPDNLALQHRMLLYYQCPTMNPTSDDFTMTTAYSAIVGDRTAWPRSGTRALAEITDGPEKTLCLVESERHRMHWMSTADPEVEMIRLVNEAGEVLVAGNHPGGVVYVRCDGSVGFLSSDTTREHLFSLINIDDDGLPAED